MRRNVLVASLTACGLVTACSAPVFATQSTPVRAAVFVDRADATRPMDGEVWYWNGAVDRLTVPLGPTRLDPRPGGPCGMIGARSYD